MGNKTHLKIYKDIKDRELKREGVFIGEGAFIVERMLASGWDVLSLLCLESKGEFWRQKIIRLRQPDSREIEVYTLPKQDMEKLLGFNFHRGVLAAGKRPELADVKNILASGKTEGGNSALVICPHLMDIENVGSIIRTAGAMGIDGIVLGSRCADPFNRKAMRVSMGAVFKVNLIRMDDEEGTVSKLKRSGFSIIGSILDSRAVPLSSLEPQSRYALVVGNEESGLSSFWIDACEKLITIPMSRGIDSLNVGVASGILIHHLQSYRIYGQDGYTAGKDFIRLSPYPK